MKNIFVQTVVAIILIFITTSCFWEDNPDPVYDPQTIEEVIAQRNYYFTCYMNGNLWYTEHYSGSSTHKLFMETHINSSILDDSLDMSLRIEAYKWPNPHDPIEKEYYYAQIFFIHINDLMPIEFGGNIDTIPYELSFEQYSSFWISFNNGFLISSTEDGKTGSHHEYFDVSDFHFWIDSVTTNPPHAFCGRFEGNFANTNSDTLHITEGVFKVKNDAWRYNSLNN